MTVLHVKVLGVGCPRCQHLENQTRLSLTKAGIPFELAKVSDLESILHYRVLGLPALVMEETVVSAGNIPRPEQIVAFALAYAPDSGE